MENTTTTPHETRTIGSLLRELFDEARDLFRQEVALAKTEATEKASMLGKNVAFIAAGGFVAFAGALFILAALSVLLSWLFRNAGLNPEMATLLGPLTVGLIVTIIGYILVQKGLKTLKDGSLKPERTIQSIKEDKEWTQQRLQRA
ncbi:MAG: phage holin family protein [Limisphaerales bacterium]